MSYKKQTAVQWFKDVMYPYLDKESKEYIDILFNHALQMEREQIEEVAMYHRDSAVEIDCIRSYMKKNYGGQDESNH
jgi:hypothetical protein